MFQFHVANAVPIRHQNRSRTERSDSSLSLSAEDSLTSTTYLSFQKANQVCMETHNRQVISFFLCCLLLSRNTYHFLVSQRTLSPLQFPPHVVAVACINLAALLSSFEKGPTQAQPGCASDHQIAAMLRTHGPWERKFQAQVEDLERQSDFSRLPSEPADIPPVLCYSR